MQMKSIKAKKLTLDRFNQLSKRSIFIIIASIALLIIIIIGGFYYISNRTNTHQDNKADIVALAEIADTNKAINMAINGNVDGAVLMLESDISNATDYKKITSSYNKLANVYIIAKKYPEALDAANKALLINNNAESWAIIGGVYVAKNDYKNAVAAYEQAVSLSQDTKDDARGNYNEFMQRLNNAKAKL